MNLSQAILMGMARRRMNQTELANESGISQQNLSAIIKRGSCTTDTLYRIAVGLGLKVSELVALGES